MAIDYNELLKQRLMEGSGVIPTPTPRPEDAAPGVAPLGASAQGSGILSLLNGGKPSFINKIFGSDPDTQSAIRTYLLQAGAGMMAAGAPSLDPAGSSFLGNAGKGVAAGAQAYAQYGKDQEDAKYKRYLMQQGKAKQDAAAAQKQLVASLFSDGGTASTPAVMPTASNMGLSSGEGESTSETTNLSQTINAQRNKMERLYSGLMQLGQGDDARPVFAQMNQLDNEMAKSGLVWDGAQYSTAPGYNAGLAQTEAAKTAGRESQTLTDDQRNFEFAKKNPDFVSDNMQKQQASEKAAAQTGFKNEQDLRKDYTSSPVYKRYDDVRASYDRIQSGAQRNSGAGDLGVIYGYMKMLDPGSVVREGEFATAENASGVPTYVANLYNKLLNGERLTEDQRKEFVGASNDLYKKEAGKMDQLNSQYTDIAKAHGIDVSKVITAPKNYDPQGAITTQEAYDKLAPGATYVGPDGVTRRKKGPATLRGNEM